MVAHFTMRTYEVNHVFRFVESIWLLRKSCQIRFFFGRDLFHIIRAQHVLSYPILYKYLRAVRPIAPLLVSAAIYGHYDQSWGSGSGYIMAPDIFFVEIFDPDPFLAVLHWSSSDRNRINCTARFNSK